MTDSSLLQMAGDVFNTFWPIIAVLLGVGIASIRYIVKAGQHIEDDLLYNDVQKSKEKPKRQALALGDDGELTEDWELVINPVEGVKDAYDD